MVPRRLLSSLAGSAFVALAMGCNAIVGNEDVEYTESPSKGPTPTDGSADSDADDGVMSSAEGGITDAEADVDAGDDEDTINDGGSGD